MSTDTARNCGVTCESKARWALSRAVGGHLLQPLRDALDDSDWRVRAYAAWSLAVAGDQGATPRLVALLELGLAGRLERHGGGLLSLI